jgi:hypothetical protein
MLYFPNVGELEMLKAEMIAQPIHLGLYSNQVIADGNTTMDTLEELLSGGGRGYALKELTNEVVLNALTADKWLISTNAQGKAQAQYHNAALTWIMTAMDVADGKTIYGAFGYALVVPFDGGVTEIKVGDTITGHTSAATGIVTQVRKFSGTWAGGTAAGELVIKTKTGTFQNDEEIWVSGAKVAVSNTGATADAHKRLIFVDTFSEGHAIDTVGLTVEYTPKMTLSTG